MSILKIIEFNLSLLYAATYSILLLNFKNISLTSNVSDRDMAEIGPPSYESLFEDHLQKQKRASLNATEIAKATAPLLERESISNVPSSSSNCQSEDSQLENGCVVYG